MPEQIPCVHCGAAGMVVLLEDVYYARCAGCNKWNKYQFLAVNTKSAIEQWNAANKPTMANRPVRTTNKWAYELDGRPYPSLIEISRIVNVSDSYIRDKLSKCGEKEGTINIRSHKITRYAVRNQQYMCSVVFMMASLLTNRQPLWTWMTVRH